MKIRRLTKADEPFLWEMLYLALYVPQGSEPFSRDIVADPAIAKYVEDWGKTTDLGFAAVDEATGQPVGAVWIRVFSQENQGYGYVADDSSTYRRLSSLRTSNRATSRKPQTGQSTIHSGVPESHKFPETQTGQSTMHVGFPELSIAVLPRYRDQGVGTDLLKHLIAQTQSLYSAITLSVSSDNPAKRLYERLGFETVAAQGSSLTMIKRLRTLTPGE